ncbi:MAG: DEAD/DEAH box helicase [bacterium]
MTASHLDGARLRAVRARFGASLGTRIDERAALGSIVLRRDQLDTLRRVRTQLSADGGCLLADDPGSGKTYVALAVARDWRAPLVVVPASLRTTWNDAMRRADVPCSLVTHEALSRGEHREVECDGIVVDESHRFRPTSLRHSALAQLARTSPVLLLSATPLQNRPRELAAQLALFLGETAYGMDSAALARYVVRGASSDAVELPRVALPRWLDVRADDGDVLRAILALPPPPRALDMGDGGALLAISLVRAWASSRAALLATVRHRRRTLVAMEQCRDEGRVPTVRELRSWAGGDGVQLGFASLLASTGIDRALSLRLAEALTAERVALDALESLLAKIDDPDTVRAAALRALRTAHAGESVLAFSESASTVGSYYRALRVDSGVGMLTSRESRIASGRISRDELLARFAPRARGMQSPPERERVTLLLATDLLSEGVNLQDASVVVHLDLPWNPARLAQRLGRVRRPGGAAEVFGYLMTPPAESALLLRAESRLRAKLKQAERTIGRGLSVMPVLGLTGGAFNAARERAVDHRDAARPSDAEQRAAIDRVLEAWRPTASALDHPRSVIAGTGSPECIVAGVTSEASGWLAVLDDGRLVASPHRDSPRLDGVGHGSDAAEVAPISFAWSDVDPSTIARALRLAEGEPRRLSARELSRARTELDACLTGDWVTRSCGETDPPPALRRAIRRRLDAAIHAVPRHRRSQAYALATRLRALLDAPMPLGAERALAEHATVPCNGEEWITSALALLERSPVRTSDGGQRRSHAIAVFVYGSSRSNLHNPIANPPSPSTTATPIDAIGTPPCHALGSANVHGSHAGSIRDDGFTGRSS